MLRFTTQPNHFRPGTLIWILRRTGYFRFYSNGVLGWDTLEMHRCIIDIFYTSKARSFLRDMYALWLVLKEFFPPAAPAAEVAWCNRLILHLMDLYGYLYALCTKSNSIFPVDISLSNRSSPIERRFRILLIHDWIRYKISVRRFRSKM